MRDRAIVNPGFGVSATGELTEDRSRLSVIVLIADLGSVDPARRDYCEILGYVRRCPIFGSLAAACRIDFSLADSGPRPSLPPVVDFTHHEKGIAS